MSEVSEPAAGRAGWSFPKGSVGHDESIKGYDVLASDGHVGTVSWADYKPGESYLVVTYHRDLDPRPVHHVVPAGAVERVDHAAHTVTLSVTADEVRASPEHQKPDKALDWSLIDQFERGIAAGGCVWPYTGV